ncbi:hypothetical protein B0H16DRAFT_1741783 [Mycena metata]|uniref:Uncharacterized protein n=1 Tax=Mycena metata TaxID=1033252 RepID=A0AAD7HAC9_9AGAR|nr:hypothetical protein B0H16DRAFT_1741783 [Mycena metata]
MAVAKSTPPRPMRAVRLRQCTPLDRWLASVEMKTSPELYMDSPLPDDHAMVELYMYVFEGVLGVAYRLSLAVFHPSLGSTDDDIHLARFVGTPHDANAPLWVRRLPPRKLLRFAQPLEFVANLVGGMTDICVKPIMGNPADERCMKRWCHDALAIISPARPTPRRRRRRTTRGGN